jgi:hypothetical protein
MKLVFSSQERQRPVSANPIDQSLTHTTTNSAAVNTRRTVILWAGCFILWSYFFRPAVSQPVCPYILSVTTAAPGDYLRRTPKGTPTQNSSHCPHMPSDLPYHIPCHSLGSIHYIRCVCRVGVSPGGGRVLCVCLLRA